MTTNPDYSSWPRWPRTGADFVDPKVKLGDQFLHTYDHRPRKPRTLNKVTYTHRGWYLEDTDGWTTRFDECELVPKRVTLTIDDVDPDEYARQITSLELPGERVAARNYLEKLFLRAFVEKQS